MLDLILNIQTGMEKSVITDQYDTFCVLNKMFTVHVYMYSTTCMFFIFV